MQRLRKEYTLYNDRIKVSMGTLNRLEPTVFYITIKTWIKPLFDNDNSITLGEIIEYTKKELLSLIIKHNLSKKYIFDSDISYANMNVNNYSFLSLQIMLKQRDNILLMKELKKILLNDISEIINNLIINCEEKSYCLSLKNG